MGSAAQALDEARIFSGTSVSTLKTLAFVQGTLFPSGEEDRLSVVLGFPLRKVSAVFLSFSGSKSDFSKHLGNSSLPIILENSRAIPMEEKDVPTDRPGFSLEETALRFLQNFLHGGQS